MVKLWDVQGLSGIPPWLARHGCTLSPLHYVLTWEPLFHRLRDEMAHLALHGVPFASHVRAKVSAYANDITVFVFHRLDILALKKAVERYEEVAGSKINFDKSKVLWLGAWRGGVPLSGPFHWSDGPIRILGVWFRPSLQLKWNWLEVQAKVEVQMGTWIQRQLSLKGQAEVCAMYIFPLILYHLPWDHWVALKQSLSKLLSKGRSL